MTKKLFNRLPHPVRWVLIVTAGFIIVAIGVVMLPLPGPGTLIIFLGLAVLSVEFEWARQVMKEGEQWMEKTVKWVKKQLVRKTPK